MELPERDFRRLWSRPEGIADLGYSGGSDNDRRGCRVRKDLAPGSPQVQPWGRAQYYLGVIDAKSVTKRG
jgi:hypothetical protein